MGCASACTARGRVRIRPWAAHEPQRIESPAVRLQEILEWSADLAGCDAVPADSMVYVESAADVRRVLFGVDIGLGEILFARDAGFEAVIAHRPPGARASLDLAAVVWRQVDQMVAEGIARDVAEAAVAQRLHRPHRAVHMAKVHPVVDTARLIGLPLANLHLACDIIGKQAIVDVLAQRSSSDARVGDAIAWI